jgi:hypothetical protein
MTKTMKVRLSERIPTVNVVYYSDPFRQFNPAEHLASHVAVTDNISDNGACILTDKAFRKGMKVKLSIRGLDTQPRIATVRWCRKSSHQFYRVGLFWPDLT